MTLESVEHFLKELKYDVTILTESVGVFRGTKYECGSCVVDNYSDFLSILKQKTSKEIWLYKVMKRYNGSQEFSTDRTYCIRYHHV